MEELLSFSFTSVFIDDVQGKFRFYTGHIQYWVITEYDKRKKIAYRKRNGITDERENMHSTFFAEIIDRYVQ